MNPASRIREYWHLFHGPRRIVATVRIDFVRTCFVPHPTLDCIRCECEGSRVREPSGELHPEYKQWLNGVLSGVAAQTGQELLYHLLKLPDDHWICEAWGYAPGETPRLSDTFRNHPCAKPLSEVFEMPRERQGEEAE